MKKLLFIIFFSFTFAFCDFVAEGNFPDDIDYGEVYDHYLFEFKSTPHLLLFDNRCFDHPCGLRQSPDPAEYAVGAKQRSG